MKDWAFLTGSPIIVNPCNRYGGPTEPPRGAIAYPCNARPACPPACPTCGRVAEGVPHECNNFGAEDDKA